MWCSGSRGCLLTLLRLPRQHRVVDTRLGRQREVGSEDRVPVVRGDGHIRYSRILSKSSSSPSRCTSSKCSYSRGAVAWDGRPRQDRLVASHGAGAADRLGPVILTVGVVVIRAVATHFLSPGMPHCLTSASIVGSWDPGPPLIGTGPGP